MILETAKIALFHGNCADDLINGCGIFVHDAIRLHSCKSVASAVDVAIDCVSPGSFVRRQSARNTGIAETKRRKDLSFATIANSIRWKTREATL